MDLECGAERIATAHKVSALMRTFELQTPMGPLELRAVSAIGRSFRLERGGRTIATIAPDHPLTRRATIDTAVEDFDAPTV
jgi:hypothetical protein